VTLYERMRTPGGWGWRIAFALSAALATVLVAGIVYTIGVGIGVWGTNLPAAWAFAIVNFVFWIGIGHAGTFISAILFLTQTRWRTPLSRIAETMTLFAVAQAAIFPILHLGRPWFAYWLVPYPQSLGVYPQVKSALPWDAAAITTYGLVSFIFWYVGLVPDLAALRDRATTRRRQLAFGLLALGWRGTRRAWRWHKAVYLTLAAIATPLVITVHSIVAMDFATGVPPGWHSTLLPFLYVVGAVFSGFAMVIVLLILIRAVFKLHDVLTDEHLASCAKLMLASSMVLAFAYMLEAFSEWYSGEPATRYVLLSGAAPVITAIAVGANILLPQILWSHRVRHSPRVLFGLSLVVLVGMWCERFSLIVAPLLRDHLPAAWGSYSPSIVDIGILAGTFGLFALLFLVFLRMLPFLPVSEMRAEEAKR
jgi:Ni/Fe-hydrogenase subunit HybB-like protein